MDIIVRKKTLIEKEKEIKFMLDYRFGLGTYDEMLGMRRQIRKERKKPYMQLWKLNANWQIMQP